jgi:hypothetical protein
MGSLALRPGDSLTILEDGFVNRLQNGKFPPHPAIQATGLGRLPRWDLLPLIMPAFAGRTLPVPYSNAELDQPCKPHRRSLTDDLAVS